MIVLRGVTDATTMPSVVVSNCSSKMSRWHIYRSLLLSLGVGTISIWGGKTSLSAMAGVQPTTEMGMAATGAAVTTVVVDPLPWCTPRTSCRSTCSR